MQVCRAQSGLWLGNFSEGYSHEQKVMKKTIECCNKKQGQLLSWSSALCGSDLVSQDIYDGR